MSVLCYLLYKTDHHSISSLVAQAIFLITTL